MPFARILVALLCATYAGAVSADEQFRLLRLDGHLVKWGVPELGMPAEVTYRLVDRSMRFADAVNCEAMQPLGPMLARNGVSGSLFRREVAAAFAAWSEIAAITFVEVMSEPADILIGAQAQPRGRAFTNVRYDQSQAGSDTRSIRQAQICFNPDQPWKVGFDGDLDVYDLRYVLTHEIGHAIGLNHPPARSALMHFGYRETFGSPQAGDIAGATAIYGETPRSPAVAAGDVEPVAVGPKG